MDDDQDYGSLGCDSGTLEVSEGVLDTRSLYYPYPAHGWRPRFEPLNSSCSRGIRSTLDSDGDSDGNSNGDSDGDSDSRFMPRKPLPLGIEYKDILFKHRSNHISRIATMPAGQPVIDLCDSD